MSDAMHTSYNSDSNLNTDNLSSMLETKNKGFVPEVKPLLLFSHDDACKLGNVSAVPYDPNMYNSETTDPIKKIVSDLEKCYSTDKEAQQHVTESTKSASDIVKSMIKDFKKGNVNRCTPSDLVNSVMADMEDRDTNAMETNSETKTMFMGFCTSKYKPYNTSACSPESVPQNPVQSEKTKQLVASFLEKPQAKSYNDRYSSERSQYAQCVSNPVQQPERLKSTVPSILRKAKPKHLGTSKQPNQPEIKTVESEKPSVENGVKGNILKKIRNDFNVALPTKTENTVRKPVKRRVKNAKSEGMVILPNPLQPVPNSKIILFSESFQHVPSEPFCNTEPKVLGVTTHTGASSESSNTEGHHKSPDQQNQQCTEPRSRIVKNRRKTDKSKKVLPVPILPKPPCQLVSLSQTVEGDASSSEQTDLVPVLCQLNSTDPQIYFSFPGLAQETTANIINQNPGQISLQPQLSAKPPDQPSSVLVQQLSSPSLDQFTDGSLGTPSTPSLRELLIATSRKQDPTLNRSGTVLEKYETDIPGLKASESIQPPSMQKSSDNPFSIPSDILSLQQSYLKEKQQLSDPQALPQTFPPLSALKVETTVIQNPMDTSLSTYSQSPPITKGGHNDITSPSKQIIPKHSCDTFISTDFGTVAEEKTNSKTVEKMAGTMSNELNLVVESVYSLAQNVDESLEDLRQNKWYIRREKLHFANKFKRNLKLHDVKNYNDFKDLKLCLPCFVVLEAVTDIQGHLKRNVKPCTLQCRQCLVKNICTKMAKDKILRRKHSVKKGLKRNNRKNVRDMKSHTQPNSCQHSIGTNISAREIMTLLQNILYINMLIEQGITNKVLPTDIKELIRLFPTISDDKGNVFRKINIANNSILINSNELESGNLPEIVNEKLRKNHCEQCSRMNCKPPNDTSSEISYSSYDSSVILSESSDDDAFIKEFNYSYDKTSSVHNFDPNDPTGLISKHTYNARSTSPWSDISDCSDYNGSSTDTIPFGMSSTPLDHSNNSKLSNENSEKATCDKFYDDWDRLPSRNTNDITLKSDSHGHPFRNLGDQSSRSLSSISLESTARNTITNTKQRRSCDQDLMDDVYRQTSLTVSSGETEKSEASVEEISGKLQGIENKSLEFFKDGINRQVEKSVCDTKKEEEAEECSSNLDLIKKYSDPLIKEVAYPEGKIASIKNMNLSTNLEYRQTILGKSQANDCIPLGPTKEADTNVDKDQNRQFSNIRDRNHGKTYMEDLSSLSSSSSEDMDMDVMTKIDQSQSKGKTVTSEMFNMLSEYILSADSTKEQQSVEVVIEKLQNLRKNFQKLFKEIKDKQIKYLHEIA